MAFSPPPVAPQRGDRTTFSGRVDAFLLWLTALIPQLNTFVSSLTTLAAGGANAFSYGFDNSTANGDPGAGRVRFGSSPQNTANVIRVSATAGNGGGIGAFLTALQAGTSNVKSALRFQKIGDVTSYLLFDITSVAAATGYYNLTVTPRASTAASPFAANDTLVLFFDPKGDKGDSGGTPTQAEIIAAIGTLGVDHGGTGATTAALARQNLGVPSLSEAVRIGQTNESNNTRMASAALPPIAAIGAAGQTNNAPLHITNLGNNDASAAMRFVRDNIFGVFIGLDTDNQFKIGGDSMGNVSYRFWHEANFSPASYARLDGAAFTAAISAPVVTETSDERKKTNWRPLTDEQLDALAEMDLVGVFDWIDGSGSAIGASAQQIQAIVPWAVHEHPQEDGSVALTVAYGGLAFAMAHGALRRSRRAAA